MESIHVFGGVHCFEDGLVVDVVGEGELDDESVDVRVVVQLLDHGKKVVLGNVRRLLDEGAVKPHTRTSLDFVSDVGAARRVVPDEHRGQMGAFPSSSQTGIHCFCEFCFDGQRRGLAVQNLRHDVNLGVPVGFINACVLACACRGCGACRLWPSCPSPSSCLRTVSTGDSLLPRCVRTPWRCASGGCR